MLSLNGMLVLWFIICTQKSLYKLCTANRLLFFYGGHTLISRTTPSRFKYLLIWKCCLFNDNVTTNYYYLWHPNSMWGVKNIVKKMKKDFECFCKLNKQHSWFVRALLCSLALSLSLNSFTGVLLSHIKLSNQIS